MDDASLVKITAAQYVRRMGLGAIRFLREMQEQAASLPDVDGARAWRDIEDAAQAIVLTLKPAFEGHQQGDPGPTCRFRVRAT